jgi:uncharacterized repeat protein (TIGR01451 family)
MKPLFKPSPALAQPLWRRIAHTEIFQPLKLTLLTLLFTVPQVPIQYPLPGSISLGGKALAQAQTSCPAGTSPQTLQWTPAPNLQDFLSQNLSVGGIATTFGFSESSPGVIDAGETRIESEVYGGLNEPNLRFNIGGNSLGRPPEDRDSSPAPVGSSATLTITFAQPVTLASPLTFLDIDRDGARDPAGRPFQDRVTIRAVNGTTPVGVTGTALGTNTRVTNQGNSVLAEGINENAQITENAGNIQVTPAGAITQIQVLYEPGIEFGPPGQDETIGLARLNICVPIPGTGSLGDTVYNDTNGNGVQDAGEPGISGIRVNLIGAGPDGLFGTPDDIIGSTNTGANGIYSFPALTGGNYRVTVNNPAPATLTATQTQPNAIALGNNQNIDTVDFGFTGQQGSIGDTVYNDTNGNSTQDTGERGIGGVTVNLVGAGPDGQFGTADDFTRTTDTDSNGRYSFSGLPAGNYRVTVNNPAPATLTATQTQPNAIALSNNQNINTVDFGFRGGTVGAANTGLRLVKRITNVFRNGQPVNIANFNTFVDDPNDPNDNILQQAGRSPLGVTQLETPLQSGDEVQYTIYYLAEGDQNLQNVSFCDLIPPETTYTSGEISVNRAGTNSLLTNTQDNDQGAFFTPLQPLPQPNQCLSQTNNKGAVTVNLGTITPDRNFGFLRFRVRID